MLSTGLHFASESTAAELIQLSGVAGLVLIREDASASRGLTDTASS